MQPPLQRLTGLYWIGKYLEKIAIEIKNIGNNDFTDHVV